ncbi:MAG: alpha/beta fold hydrolase [Oscillospiraceae bacterium]|jgi:carboxylesterase|nr:alpha/beta fold hydrolase [Oscillospiraceae bacterium]
MENKPVKKNNVPNFNDAKSKPFFFGDGSIAVLLIHGFTGSPAHMRPLGEALRDAGYTVRGILLPGHAETVAAMGRTDWTEWLGASEKALKTLLETHDKVVVGGLSMGGLIACRLAEQYPAAGLLCYAPALKFKRRINNLAPIVKHLFPYMAWGTNERLTNPGFMKEYNIGYFGLPVAKVEDLMKIQKATIPELNKITCPTLVVQSKFDEQVHRSVPDMLINGISSKTREVMWLTQSPHVCTIGADHDEVFERTLQFLRKNVG